MIRHVTEHGYGRFGSQGGRIIILAHPNQVENMTFWRAGVEYATGTTPTYDYVPSAAQPAYLTTEHLVGAIPPTDFNGLQVLGSYGASGSRLWPRGRDPDRVEPDPEAGGGVTDPQPNQPATRARECTVVASYRGGSR